MTMKANFLRVILLIFSLYPAVAQNDQSPNVIIIFTDDLGYGDLGVYGHPTIKTPHLDRMAQEGTKFTQFYVAASVCTPSRAAILTGKYPIRTGMVEGIIPGRVLFPNSNTGLAQSHVTIAEVLKQNSYATKAVGKWHLGHLPEYLPINQGFDEYYGIPYSNDMDYVTGGEKKSPYWNVPLMRDTKIIERPAEQTTLTKRYTEESIKFIEKNREKLFFLYLAHTMPHIPLFASDDFTGKSRRGLYGDVVEEIDWSVGKILNTLKELDLDENTLVIFTSDNGPWLVQDEDGGSAGLLREGKGTTWEGGMRVPMLAWWPGKIPANRVSEDLFTSLDVLPTIAKLTKSPMPEEDIDGIDMSSVLFERKPSEREFFAFYRGDKLFAIRYGPWKAHFITQTAYPAGPLKRHSPPLLYHLEKDPSEKYNVSEDNPEIIGKIEELRKAHNKKLNLVSEPSIEGEDLVRKAEVTGGRVRIQEMDNFSGKWSGNQHLWWTEATKGDKLSFEFTVEESRKYELIGFFTRAKDYGIVQLMVNGKTMGNLMDGYNEGVSHSGPVSFGSSYLEKGTHTLTIEIVGKDVRAGGYSDGYLVGLDGILLR